MTSPHSIAIDTSALFMTKAGVARYVRSLLNEFSLTGSESTSFHEVAWGVENFDYQQPKRAIKTAYRELVWAKWIAPRSIQDIGAETLFSPNGWLIRPPSGIRNVVTVHDLAVIDEPQRYRKWNRKSTAARLGKTHRADKIICISKFTASRLMHQFGIPASQIEVIYNGGAMLLDNTKGQNPSIQNLPSEYFLFVGSLEPGKNLSLLKKIYEQCEQTGLILPPLVIAGSRWAGVPHEGIPPKNWVFLDRISDPILIQLYQNALGLLFPSKYEGFGLPVVEAMSLGCPVVCAPIASLPEVGGEAALYAPLDCDEWKNAILSLTTNHSLRTELRERGFEHSKKFTWKRCAQETLQVLTEFKSF